MTDDFKKNILNYVTNNLTTTDPQERTAFLEASIKDGSDWEGDILPTSYSTLKYLGYVSPRESTSDLTILYGYYYDDETSQKGIITLLNSEFKPIKSIFQYNSGTFLKPILCLEQSDDNTFYGIDSTRGNSPTCRFIMLNNFAIPNSLGEYNVDLRKSYNFANSYRIDTCYKMYKSPYSAHYVMFGSYSTTMKVIDLKVNTGETNEWNLKTFAASSGNQYQQEGTPLALFDEDENVWWKFLVRDTTPWQSIKSITKDYGTETTVIQTLVSGTEDKPVRQLYDYYFIDKNNVFFGIGSGYSFQNETILYKYDFSSDVLTQIYSGYLPTDSGILKINICNSDVYFCAKFINDLGFKRIGFTRLVNERFVDWFYDHGVGDYDLLTVFLVKQNYNLVNIVGFCSVEDYIDIPNTVYVLKDNYNSLNYNGYAYTDYNSMIPEQGEIYSNNSLVFARNLSDKTINNNTTTSTIVVPNLYLNDINIDTQNLLSETNSSIINNQNTITKNIYETGFFNFINILNVIDNNSENSILLNNVASYINENINTGTQTNYENSFIGKLQVTYEDNSTMVTDITWNKENDTQAYTEFALTLSQPILQMDLISYDLTMSYLTILPENLEVGSTYKFTQYLKIE